MIDRKRGYYDEAAETMPAAKRAQAEREMLRATVLHAYEQAPATRRKMDDAGVRPGDVRETADGQGLKCVECHRVYPIEDEIPVMLIDEASIEPERRIKD